jgi:hypothetical protein
LEQGCGLKEPRAGAKERSYFNNSLILAGSLVGAWQAFPVQR